MAMGYKKRAFIVFLALFFVFSVNAMPPHPKNKNPSGRERTENISNLEGPLYNSMMRSSPSRASGFSGEMHLLVILADFGADIEKSHITGAPLVLTNGPNNKSGYIIPALLLIFLIIQILFKNKKRYMLLNLYLLIVLSCSNDSLNIPTGDPLDFKTSPNYFEQILDTHPNSSFLTMKKYWHDMSNGNLTLNFDIVGPVRVSKGWQYYGRNKKSGLDSYPAQFVGEAVHLVHSQGLVPDFSKYDNNNDGNVDTIIVIHAGSGEEFSNNSNEIWSHSWELNSGKSSGDGKGAIFLDGVWINRYTIQSEYNMSPGDASIGVFCHEFAHVLGLPDLYDTNSETLGVGSWSLMGTGSWGSYAGEDPAPLLAWERSYLGESAWVETVSYSKTAQSITGISGDIETSRKAYKIPLDSANAATSSQYLLIEKKTYTLPYYPGDVPKNKFVPASGFLITHINKNIINSYMNSNKINAGKNRAHGVNIVEADGTNAGGKGLLWSTSENFNFTNYQNMIFTAGEKIQLPTEEGNDDNSPNSNYYINENASSKTGYSGIEIVITSNNSFNINIP